MPWASCAWAWSSAAARASTRCRWRARPRCWRRSTGSRFEVVPIGISRDGPLARGRRPAARPRRGGGAARAGRRAIATRPTQARAGRARAARPSPGPRSCACEAAEGLPAGLRERPRRGADPAPRPAAARTAPSRGCSSWPACPTSARGVLGSAVGMDKVAMKDLFRAHGLPIVEYVVVTRHEWRADPRRGRRARSPSAIGFPCFVKPANLGSSVGISKVKAPEDLGRRRRAGGRPRPARPGRARRRGPRGGGRGARQRRAPRLRAGRGVLRRRVVRLRDEVRRGADHVQDAGAAVPGDHRARPRPRRPGLPRHRLRGHGARGLLRRGRPACS